MAGKKRMESKAGGVGLFWMNDAREAKQRKKKALKKRREEAVAFARGHRYDVETEPDVGSYGVQPAPLFSKKGKVYDSEEVYTHPYHSYDPNLEYCEFNMGILQAWLQQANLHGRRCEGKLYFLPTAASMVGVHNKFLGSMYCEIPVRCTECCFQSYLPNDGFEEAPPQDGNARVHSRLSMLTTTAHMGSSLTFSDYTAISVAQNMRSRFSNPYAYRVLTLVAGDAAVECVKDVCKANIEEEKTLSKVSPTALPQVPNPHQPDGSVSQEDIMNAKVSNFMGY